MNTVNCMLNLSDASEQSLQREVKGSGRQYYKSLSESLIAIKEEVNSIVTVEVEKAKQQQTPAQSNKRLQDKDSSEGNPIYSTICNTAKERRQIVFSDSTTMLLDNYAPVTYNVLSSAYMDNSIFR